jgi:hypothetical protein
MGLKLSQYHHGTNEATTGLEVALGCSNCPGVILVA